MKKIVKISTLTIFTLLMSGCAQNTFNVNIKNLHKKSKSCNNCNTHYYKKSNNCCATKQQKTTPKNININVTIKNPKIATKPVKYVDNCPNVDADEVDNF